jgi:hypothetical protein
MSKWHGLWLIASFVISFATNRAFKPHLEHPLSPGQRTLTTGTLTFDSGNGEELKIVNVFVVAHDLPRVMSQPLRVRELLIRSPEADDGQEPDIELFFDFTAPKGKVIAVDARDMAELRERDLPLLPTAIGATTRSRVRFPGAAAPSYANDGSLRITQTFDLDDDDSGASWRVEGDVQLTLADGDSEHTVKGTISARVTW